MFHEIVSHEQDDGSTITIGRGQHGEYLAVLDALGGLELTIEFIDVEVGDRTIEFKYSAFTDGRAESTVATVERDDFGEVEAFLEAFDPREVEA